MEKEPYNPLPELTKQFFWAVRGVLRYRGTPDEEKFLKIARHLESEIKKYIFE